MSCLRHILNKKNAILYTKIHLHFHPNYIFVNKKIYITQLIIKMKTGLLPSLHFFWGGDSKKYNLIHQYIKSRK